MENEKDTVLLDTLKPGDKFEWSGTCFRALDEPRPHACQVRCSITEGKDECYVVVLHAMFEVAKLEPKPTTVTLEELEPGDTFTWVGAEFLVKDIYDEWVVVRASKDGEWNQHLWSGTQVTVMR